MVAGLVSWICRQSKRTPKIYGPDCDLSISQTKIALDPEKSFTRYPCT